MMANNFHWIMRKLADKKEGQNDGVQALHFECNTKDVPVVMPYLKCTYRLE